MNRSTTAVLYTCFKTALGVGTALIGSSIINSTENSEFLDLKEAAEIGSLGGAVLGIVDYIAQNSMHYLTTTRGVSPELAAPIAVVSFFMTNASSGVLGLKLLSLALESNIFTYDYPTIFASSLLGSGILAGGAVGLLCVGMGSYRLFSRGRPAEREVYSTSPTLPAILTQ